MGGRGSVSLSYQGNNGGSGRAFGKGTILEARDAIEKYVSKNYKVTSDAAGQSAMEIVRSVVSGDDSVTIYRATPSNRINTGDWVFLTREQADRFSRSPFSGKRKSGFNVVEIKTTADNVQWTGKNLEFMYAGKGKRGKRS